MVFVHARNATGRVAAILKEQASNKGHTKFFTPENTASYGLAQKSVRKSYFWGNFSIILYLNFSGSPFEKSTVA